MAQGTHSDWEYGAPRGNWSDRNPDTTPNSDGMKRIVIVGSDVEIGEGTCLAPGVIVTTRTTIGRHCILNIHSSVSHDCVFDDYVNINPGATVCGNVCIGEGSYIGAGATIKDKVSIGEWS